LGPAYSNWVTHVGQLKASQVDWAVPHLVLREKIYIFFFCILRISATLIHICSGAKCEVAKRPAAAVRLSIYPSSEMPRPSRLVFLVGSPAQNEYTCMPLVRQRYYNLASRYSRKKMSGRKRESHRARRRRASTFLTTSATDAPSTTYCDTAGNISYPGRWRYDDRLCGTLNGWEGANLLKPLNEF